MSKKILFLDRDGVINRRAEEHHYITKVEDFVFNDGIFDMLNKFIEKGFEIIVITNQRGVAREILSLDDLRNIHSYMIGFFKKNGIAVLDIFYCPHNEGVCNCRKPRPGLLEQACLKYNIDLEKSVLISDSASDIRMGIDFGINKNYLIELNNPKLLNID